MYKCSQFCCPQFNMYRYMGYYRVPYSQTEDSPGRYTVTVILHKYSLRKFITWLNVCTTSPSNMLKSETSSHQKGSVWDVTIFKIPAWVHSTYKHNKKITKIIAHMNNNYYLIKPSAQLFSDFENMGPIPKVKING